MSKVKQFVNDVQGELKKTSWPKKEDIKKSAIIVVIATVLLGCFVGAIDFVFSRVVTLVIS